MRDFAKSVTMSHTWNHRLQSLWDLYWESLQSETSLQVILPSSALVGKFNWTWAELALLSVFPSSDPTWPDPTRPDPTWPDPTLKSIKTLFYSKTCFVQLVLLVEVTPFGRQPQFVFQMEDDLNLFSMEDDLNFFQMEYDLNFLQVVEKLNILTNGRRP